MIGCVGLGFVPASAQTPRVAIPAVRPSAGPTGDPSREALLRERVRQLEAKVETLSARVKAISPPPKPIPPPRPAMPAIVANVPGDVKFGPGFEIKTTDDEFDFQFHNLTQFDYRGFQQAGQDPVRDTFAVPRQWLMFKGQLTKPYEYFVSVAHGFTGMNILDVFLNIHFDDRLQFRFGRFVVPSQYEYYALPIFGLNQPEFSLFFNNFAYNRDLGIMAWGQLLQKRVDYATGIFNGTRNGFVDTNDAKDLVSYLNVRPFGGAGIPALEYLNIGGAVTFGNQSAAPNPQTLSISVPTPGNATIGVPFLAWNSNVRESGDRSFWSLHAAYYYRHLSLIAEWESGFEDYALAGSLGNRTHLPVQSYFVEAGYFLTGETVSGRGVVKPLRPFDLRRGRFGLGAWELTGRYNTLDLGRQVFTAGLADPNLWTNHVSLVDAGLNWTLNQYVKVYFDWEHAEFGSPVQFAPGRQQLTSDLFWVRFQLYF